MRNAIMGVCVAVAVGAFFLGVYGAETMNLGAVLLAIGVVFVAVAVGAVAWAAEVRG